MASTVLEFRGATENDYSFLLHEVLKPRSLLVCRDRQWTKQRWIKEGQLDQLPQFGYAALSNKHYSPVMVIDVDEEYAASDLVPLGFRPNWIGRNVVSGHYQLILYLNSPVYPEQRPYFTEIQRALSRVISGDNHFAMSLGRNPFSISGEYEWHSIHHESHELSALHSSAVAAGGMVLEKVQAKAQRAKPPSPTERIALLALPLALRTLAEPTFDGEGLQRYAFIFLAGRMHAYRIRGLGKDIDESQMFTYLDEINQEIGLVDPRGPLADYKVIKTARSITNWVNSRMVRGQRANGAGSAPYTVEQCVRGGQATGARNLESGHWDRISGLGRAKGASNSRVIRGTKKAVDFEEIQQMARNGMKAADIVRLTPFLPSKVQRALVPLRRECPELFKK
jgi:hypothetical protein